MTKRVPYQSHKVCVYMSVNLVTGQKYIGSCVDLDKRRTDKFGKSNAVRKAVKEYGKENFVQIILYNGEDYRQKEVELINMLNVTNDPTYYNSINNLAHDNNVGKPLTEEHRTKISKGILKGNPKKIKYYLRGKNGSKLLETDIRAIRLSHKSNGELAKKYSLTKCTISRIRNGVSFKTIPWTEDELASQRAFKARYPWK